jgi:hypothetical protein
MRGVNGEVLIAGFGEDRLRVPAITIYGAVSAAARTPRGLHRTP